MFTSLSTIVLSFDNEIDTLVGLPDKFLHEGNLRRRHFIPHYHLILRHLCHMT